MDDQKHLKGFVQEIHKGTAGTSKAEKSDNLQIIRFVFSYFWKHLKLERVRASESSRPLGSFMIASDLSKG